MQERVSVVVGRGLWRGGGELQWGRRGSVVVVLGGGRFTLVAIASMG